MLSQSTPMEQQDRPSSLTFPALLHPNASISQSFSLRKTVTQVALSILSSFLRSYSVAVRFISECSSLTREGVLKKRGSSMRCGWEGAIERLLRCLLKLLTSFSQAREAPMRNDRFRFVLCREWVRLVLLSIIKIPKSIILLSILIFETQGRFWERQMLGAGKPAKRGTLNFSSLKSLCLQYISMQFLQNRPKRSLNFSIKRPVKREALPLKVVSWCFQSFRPITAESAIQPFSPPCIICLTWQYPPALS